MNSATSASNRPTRNISVRGGRVTKWQGKVANCATSLLAGVSVSVLAGFVASPAFAANECGPDTPGASTVNCAAAAYPAGVTYTNSDGLTVNLSNPAMVVGSAVSGVQVNSSAANVNAIVVNGTSFPSITTTGAGGHGILALNAGTAGAATVSQASGTITTAGFSAHGILADITNATNAAVATATMNGGTVNVAGGNSIGVYAITFGLGA